MFTALTRGFTLATTVSKCRTPPIMCDSTEMLLGLLRTYVRPYRSLIAIVASLQVISTLASLYLPTVNAAIIDEGVAKGDTTRSSGWAV